MTRFPWEMSYSASAESRFSKPEDSIVRFQSFDEFAADMVATGCVRDQGRIQYWYKVLHGGSRRPELDADALLELDARRLRALARCLQ